MTQQTPPPAAPSATLDAPLDARGDPALEAPLDAHGFNPDDYQWVPVLRKARSDGWSPEKQRTFIETLADSGSVIAAAQMVGMSERSAYKLRRSPGAESFDRAWRAATEAASKRLLDEAFERALIGSDEPVFDRDGNRVDRRLRQSDKMLQFLLRAYMPERFGGFRPANDRGAPTVDPVRALEAPKMADALAQMLPETPAEPHHLMNDIQLEDALFVADQMEGKLPSWFSETGVIPDDQPLPKKASMG